MSEIGHTLILVECTLIVKVSGYAQPAIGPLAGAFADSAAGADIVEQNRIILHGDSFRNGLDRTFGHHFTFTQDKVIGLLFFQPGFRRQPRLGPFAVQRGRQGFMPRAAGGVNFQACANLVGSPLRHQPED